MGRVGMCLQRVASRVQGTMGFIELATVAGASLGLAGIFKENNASEAQCVSRPAPLPRNVSMDREEVIEASC